VRGPGGDDQEFKGAALVSGEAPDLTHFATRGVFAGAVFDLWIDQNDNGEIETSEIGKQLNVAALKQWLEDPPGQVPMAPDEGRGMPNLHLTPSQIDQLIAYLRTLE
jgi:hypothetical protein